MGFLDSLSALFAASYEKKVSKMRLRGACPDCRGRGFYPSAYNEYMFISLNDFYCSSCNGSGLFADWEANRL